MIPFTPPVPTLPEAVRALHRELAQEHRLHLMIKEVFDALGAHFGSDERCKAFLHDIVTEALWPLVTVHTTPRGDMNILSIISPPTWSKDKTVGWYGTFAEELRAIFEPTPLVGAPWRFPETDRPSEWESYE